MKKTNITKASFETKLPIELIKAWQNTILRTARLKGMDKEASDSDKLAQVIRQEQNNVRQLWEAFTTERENLPRYLLDPKKQTTAYLLGFHLPNVARTWNLLRRLDRRYNFGDALTNYKKIKMFDVGCGTGSLGHGFAAFLKSLKVKAEIEVGLIDQQGPFLDAAKLGYEGMGFKGSIKSHKGTIEQSVRIIEKSMDPDALNVILLGYVWNEISKNSKAQRKLLDLIHEHSNGNTLVIILEPANQYISRSAMELRDQINTMDFQSIYPCIHSNPCPMLKRAKDWCYSETTWDVPPQLMKIDRAMKVNRQKLRYAGHVLCTGTVKAKLIPRFPDQAYPIVGLPTIKEKEKENAKAKPVFVSRLPKKYEYLVCQEEKLDKFSSSISKKGDLQRGALLYTAPQKTK